MEAETLQTELDEPRRVKQARVSTIDTHRLHKRFLQLKSDRSPVEQIWDGIDRYIMPLGSAANPQVQLQETSVRWNRWELYDSTGVDSHQKLSASIHGSITSPANRWFKLAWRDAKLREDNDAASWLEKAGDQLFDELQDSDFNVEIQSAYQDLVGPGNTLVIEEPRSVMQWRGLDFTCIPLREGYFEEDSKGGIETFYRLLNWSPVQILDKFGDECPPDIREKAEKGTDVTERIGLVFCVFEREDAVKRLEAMRQRNCECRKANQAAKALRTQQQRAQRKELPPPAQQPEDPLYPLAPTMRPFGFVYFRADNGEPIGAEGGYYEMPVFVCRWSKTSGSRWGHGPGNVALPDCKHVNAMKEADQRSAEKVVDPAWGVTERGLLSDLDLKPGGITVFHSKDDVWVMESKARFDVTEGKIRDLQQQIRAKFHVDELQLKDSPQMTAMEAQIRYELMQRVLGSPLNRIEADLLNPAVQVAFGLMMRAGRFPKPPQSVTDALNDGGADYNIEYLGPLARSQRADQVASIERLFAFASALLKMGIPLQVVKAIIDFPAAVRQMAKLLGTPADLVKAKEKVEEELKRLDEMQARANAAQVQQAEGEAKLAHASAASMAAGGQGPRGLPVPARPDPVVAPEYQNIDPAQAAAGTAGTVGAAQ